MSGQTGKLSSLSSDLKGVAYDVFVASASFEARCLSVAAALGNAAATKAFICHNVDHAETNQENRRKFDSLLASATDLSLYSNDPIQSADSFAEALGPVFAGETKRLLIDITAFTRETLLVLLAYLRVMVRDDDRLSLIYSAASEYSVGDDADQKWLSKGIREVRTVLGYPGCLSPTRRNHLVVMMGFEDERAIELVRELEPTHVSLGIGDDTDPATAPHQEANIHHFNRVRNIVGDVATFRFSPYDPVASKVALAKQSAMHKDCNIVVAPMNTKLATLGAALFAMEDQSVQLCYAPANIYNYKRYSAPGDTYYLLDMQLPR